MEWYEAAFDRLYPVLYSHRDSREAETALNSFGRCFEGKTPVLDLASGDGRYLEALLQRGVDAYGLDLSHYLLARSAAEWGHGGRLVQADMRHLPFCDGSFGGALNMFTSFGYFSVDTDNLLVFREVQRVLKGDGVFLFDFINAERIANELLEESSRESQGYEIHERRRIEGHGKYLVKRAEVTNKRTNDKEEIEERLRLYTLADLVMMFESVGLIPREFYGDYMGNAFARGVSERVIILSAKP
ncbi:MAG: class I SAM-dependent methyltransferase [Candidatus Krumholzibacteriia bacterium]